MTKKQKLELTWIGKDNRPKLEPRAITSYKQSGNNPNHHFAGAGNPITGGKGAVQIVDDYHLSRFACYLAHEQVGKGVRDAIKRIGGGLPERI